MDMTREIPYVVKVAAEVVKNVLDKRNADRLSELREKSGEMYFETKAWLDDMLSDAQECSQVLVDIFADALRDAGRDIPSSRSLINPEIQTAVYKEIAKSVTIIPYTPDEN